MSSPIAARVPIGIELWTVRTDLTTDYLGTLSRVAGLGYQTVEIFSTYLDWPLETAREVRKRLDDRGMTCLSTHNGMRAFPPETIGRTAELNHILGSRMAIVASVPPVADLTGWKEVTGRFADVAERLRSHGLVGGYHNNQREWTPIEGVLPMNIVADGTPTDFVLQFDVGPAVEHRIDPAKWIEDHQGRVRSIHLRDWSASRGYNIAFGEGDCPWMAIFAAAERVGGVENYLVENGHCSPEEEWGIAERSLQNFRALR